MHIGKRDLVRIGGGIVFGTGATVAIVSLSSDQAAASVNGDLTIPDTHHEGPDTIEDVMLTVDADYYYQATDSVTAWALTLRVDGDLVDHEYNNTEIKQEGSGTRTLSADLLAEGIVQPDVGSYEFDVELALRLQNDDGDIITQDAVTETVTVEITEQTVEAVAEISGSGEVVIS